MEAAETEKGQRTRGAGSLPGVERTSSAPGVQEIIASSGISLRFWRLYAYFWLVCLALPIIYLTRASLTPVRLVVAIGGLVIFVATYLWVMWPHPLSERGSGRSGWRSSPLLCTGLVMLVLLLSLTHGRDFTWLFLGVSAIAGITLPARRAFWAVMGLTLLTLGVSVGLSDGIAGTDWLQVIPLVLLVRGLGVDMAGLARLAEALRELQATRQELARQAVMEERLRLARDLHDLLGRTLSMITLKSELAGRLIEKDPGRAAQEVHDVEREARQALREVRQAVAGYRSQTLDGELDGARQILEAAGIACTVENETKSLSTSLEAALAWSIREGVTNVIRHSHAKQCSIRITGEHGYIRLEVINDGYNERGGLSMSTGSGLSGLAERVADQGGRIEAGPLPTQSGLGFRLQVELPFQSVVDRKDAKGR